MSDRTIQFGIRVTADGKVATAESQQIARSFDEIGKSAKAAAAEARSAYDIFGMKRGALPVTGQVKEIEMSAKQAAFAMRMLPAQMTDIAVGLASGQSPFMVLMQQGGQLKDMFGGIGPAVKAVGAFVAGLINPFTVTAVAAAGMGYALKSAFEEPHEPAKDLKTAVGDLASAVDAVGKASRDFSMDNLYKEFNKANAAARQGIIEQVKFQQALIETQQKMAEQSLAKTLDGIGDYGFGDKMMGAFASSAGEKLSKELGVSVSLANELLPALKGLNKHTEDAGNFMARFGVELAKSSNGRAQQLLKDIKAVADGGKDAAAAQSRLSEALQKMGDAGSSGMIALEGKAKAARAEVDVLAALLNRIYSKESGLDASYWKDLETLNKAYVSGRIGIEAYRDAVAKLTTVQKFHQDAVKADADALKLWVDASARAAQEAEKQLQSLEAKALAMENEVKYYGMTEGAIQRTIIAQLEEQRTRAASTDSQERTVELLDEEIARRKRLAAAADSKDALDANKRATEQMQRDWERMHEQLGQSLTDELMRGGKNAGELLQNYFKTLVLRPIIQGAVNIGMNAIRLGAPPGLSGGSGGSLGNLFSLGSSANNLLGGSSLYSSFAASSIGQSMGLSLGSLSGPTLAGEALSGTAFTGIGTAIPYIGAALAVASMFSKESTPHAGGIAFSGGSGYSLPTTKRDIFANFSGDSRIRRTPWETSMWNFSESDWTKRNSTATSAQLGSVAEGFAKTLNGILAANGLGNDYSIGAAFSADGDDPARGRAAIIDAAGNIVAGYRDKNDLGKDAGKAMQKFVGTELPQLLLATLEGMNLNALADSYLDTLNIEKLSADAAQQALAFVDATDEIVAALGDLGISASEASFDLITALGGIDVAGSKLSAYYDAFYSEEERRARLMEQISGRLAGFNLAMPANRDEYRGLIESLDLTTDAGRDMLNTLLDLAPAFAQITEAVDVATQSVDEWRFKTLGEYIYGQRTGVIPHYAAGGYHDGGWALVGEDGPELANLGPSRIYSNNDSRSLIDMSGVLNELASLRRDLRAGQAAMATSLNVMAKKIRQWDGDGMPAVRVLS